MFRNQTTKITNIVQEFQIIKFQETIFSVDLINITTIIFQMEWQVKLLKK